MTNVDAQLFKDRVQELFNRSYGSSEYTREGDAFHSSDAFMSRFDKYASNPRLDMVIAYLDGDAVGQSWGWPDDGKWQSEINEPLNPDAAKELGGPSFALSEIMVAREYWGRGIAKEILDELLVHRPEPIVTLFVDPSNERAYARYLQWGWWKIGTSQPQWQDAPVFDVLIAKIAELVRN